MLVGEENQIKKISDEPQHITQGKETQNFLKSLGIKYKIVDSKCNIKKIIKYLKNYSNKKKTSCLYFGKKKNTFKTEKYKINDDSKKLNFREELLESLVDILPDNSTVVSTTGILSRELNEILKKRKKK